MLLQSFNLFPIFISILLPFIIFKLYKMTIESNFLPFFAINKLLIIVIIFIIFFKINSVEDEKEYKLGEYTYNYFQYLDAKCNGLLYKISELDKEILKLKTVKVEPETVKVEPETVKVEPETVKKQIIKKNPVKKVGRPKNKKNK